MKRILIHNATLVNEGQRIVGSMVLENGKIAEILTNGRPLSAPCDEMIDASGCFLIPGVIDAHVHFRDPGLTEKADILSESKAAAAGGVTSIMDMPNTKPATTTLEALDNKFELMSQKSLVNYSCYFGATNKNYTDFDKLDRHRVCGIKLFMGASTGNMLVDSMRSLVRIFTGTDLLIAAHCEDSSIIQQNAESYKMYTGSGDIPMTKHSAIRSVKACWASSSLAVKLATDAQARLHILHVSTSKELSLFSNAPISEKRITAEACVPHLLFAQTDYHKLGARIKCNPSVKRVMDRRKLRDALNEGYLDNISTDHAPHLWADKQGGALTAASGMPMVQFSLPSMLNLVDEGVFTLEKVVEKMCHAPAEIYHIANRGYLREGYQADIVLIRPQSPWTLTNELILSKCQWSPLEGQSFNWKVEKTFVNGNMVYDGTQVNEDFRGEALYFN